VDGSTSVYPMLSGAAKKLATEHPGYDVEVRESSSGDGIRRFIAGEIDIAATSRPPKEGEYAAAVERNRPLYLTNVAFDAVVVIVHPSNPIANLREAQLRALFFDGNLRDWAALTDGQKTGAVHVYAASAKQSGLTDFLAHHVTGKSDTPLVPGAKGVSKDPELIAAVADDPDGISIAALGRGADPGSRVKIVDIESVKPSERSVLMTDYPLSRRVYVISNGRPQGVEREFIGYLMGIKGQTAARENGLVPVALELQ
jgi:phosphate transport system substrate-binding protein